MHTVWVHISLSTFFCCCLGRLPNDIHQEINLLIKTEKRRKKYDKYSAQFVCIHLQSLCSRARPCPQSHSTAPPAHMLSICLVAVLYTMCRFMCDGKMVYSSKVRHKHVCCSHWQNQHPLITLRQIIDLNWRSLIILLFASFIFLMIKWMNDDDDDATAATTEKDDDDDDDMIIASL